MSGQDWSPRDERMLRWFDYEHLPEGPLRHTSALFGSLAYALCDRLPPSPERTKALNELKVAKDWAVCCEVDQAKARQDPTVGRERAGLDSPALRYEDPGMPPSAGPDA